MKTTLNAHDNRATGQGTDQHTHEEEKTKQMTNAEKEEEKENKNAPCFLSVWLFEFAISYTHIYNT